MHWTIPAINLHIMNGCEGTYPWLLIAGTDPGQCYNYSKYLCINTEFVILTRSSSNQWSTQYNSKKSNYIKDEHLKLTVLLSDNLFQILYEISKISFIHTPKINITFFIKLIIKTFKKFNFLTYSNYDQKIRNQKV